MIVEGFLLGLLAAASLIAAVFFLRFWKETRDVLFLTFAAFFLIEAVSRGALLFLAKPNEGSPWIYLFRLIALLWILVEIVRKNSSDPNRHP